VEQPRYESLAVFSPAPMLLVVIAVARLAFGREAAQGAIVDELGGLIGGQTGRRSRSQRSRFCELAC
jgi:hypothetical protein